MLTEPCRPYDLRDPRPYGKDGSLEPRPNPVSVHEIIGRLTPYELRRLALALAIHNAAVFEERILELGQQRRPA